MRKEKGVRENGKGQSRKGWNESGKTEVQRWEKWCGNSRLLGCGPRPRAVCSPSSGSVQGGPAGGPCRGWKGAGLQGRGSKAQAPFVWVVGSRVMPPSPYVFSAHDSTLFFVFLFFITGPQFMR